MLGTEAKVRLIVSRLWESKEKARDPGCFRLLPLCMAVAPTVSLLSLPGGLLLAPEPKEYKHSQHPLGHFCRVSMEPP